MTPGDRPPAVSGRFYPADPDELSRLVDRFVLEANRSECPRGDADAMPGPAARCAGIVVPHAGYMYSGQVAAQSWASVRTHPDTIVLFGPDHFTGYPHVAVYARGAFATPLGSVRIDEDFAQEILSPEHHIVDRPEVHGREHSLEVQLPFIQRLFPSARVVPILLGYKSARNVEVLADRLAQAGSSRDVLFVASSDLSHYHPRERASRLDARIVARIEDMDPTGLKDDLLRGEAEACGGDALVLFLATGQRLGASAAVLEYADSGRVNGDLGSVVGYVAAHMEIPAPAIRTPSPTTVHLEEEILLTAEEEKDLLALARRAVSEAARGRPDSETADEGWPPHFRELRGAFVTIRSKGELCGCIGFSQPIHPLARTVRLAARAAVLEDSRFQPLTPDQADHVSIEISVLTEPEPGSPGDVEIGRHGLMVSRGERRGLLLPQVAVEHGWSSDRFVSETCRKAGLPPDALSHGARLELFQATIYCDPTR